MDYYKIIIKFKSFFFIPNRIKNNRYW